MSDSTQLRNLHLAIVCPMANEGGRAIEFVEAVLQRCEEFKTTAFFVVLDRASKDDTLDRLRAFAQIEPRLRVVWAPENRGVVDAYVRGYREALTSPADWILEIDGGFSHQPEDIPLLLTKIGEGYEVIFGSRFCEGGSIKDSSRQRFWVSWGGTRLTNALLGTRLKDMTSGFELFSRHALQMVLDRGIRSRGPFFQTEIKTYCRRLRIAEVPIQYRAASHQVGRRAIGDALRNLWRLLRLRLVGAV